MVPWSNNNISVISHRLHFDKHELHVVKATKAMLFMTFLSSIFVSYTFFTSVIFVCTYRMYLVVHAYYLLIVMLFSEFLQVWFLLYFFGFKYWTFEAAIQFVISNNTFKSPEHLEVGVGGYSFCPGLALSSQFFSACCYAFPWFRTLLHYRTWFLTPAGCVASALTALYHFRCSLVPRLSRYSF